ncbi:MAG: ribosome silencing factor [Phycisphaerales bacterium]|jgi:ribosome-associated protein|nr:ribosome silencing factor [Phycisphaerales bacterium]
MAKKSDNDAAKMLAIGAARIASDSHCDDVVVLDLRGISPVTDYFVIATGTSGRQMRSVADDVSTFGRSIEQPPWHKAGIDSAQWVLLDFVDVVVHLFDEQARGYYDLELMWGESPRVEWARES